MKRLLTIPGLALLLIVLPWIALGATWQWAEGSGNEDGATREFFNSGASLKWNTFMGDWVDQAGTPYGAVPFATATIVDDDTNQTLSFDLTGIANEWLSGARLNNGILLTSDRGGPFNFRSREYADAAERPKLELTVDGQLQTLDAQADTNLSKSTYKSQGTNDFFRLRHNATTQNETPLLRFDLSTFEGKTVTSATLKIVSYVQYGGGQATVNVFSVPAQLASDSPVANGIAAQYDSDRGIAAHPDVYFATDFEETDGPWAADWTRANGFVDLVSPTDTSHGFSPFNGKALRTRFETADNYGMDVSYEFMDKQVSEPDDVFFRYYLRLGDDWNQTVDGGKLPGIAGRYGRAGWGGRKPSATDPTKFGWSARGYYAKTIPTGGNPLGGTTPIGNYIYHLDQGSQFGENNLWTVDQKGYIPTDRWYCIEQYVKMNTVGQADGIYRAWVDGQLAFERSDFRFRSVDTLHIEEIWLNFYHGGTAKSPYDQHAYLDNVVISKSYIGPLVFKTFGTWLPTYDPSLSGSDLLPIADPNNNGVENLLEYGLDSPSPGAATSTYLPNISTHTDDTGCWARFDWRERSDSSDLTYTVESSQNLSSWSPVVIDGINATQTILDDDPDTDSSARLNRTSMKVSTDDHFYYRLKVEMSPRN